MQVGWFFVYVWRGVGVGGGESGSLGGGRGGGADGEREKIGQTGFASDAFGTTFFRSF